MTDLYSNIQMVKLFAAEDTEAGSLRTIMGDAIGSQKREGRVFLTADTGVVLLNVAMVLATVASGLWGLAAGFVTIGQFVASIAIVQRLSANARASPQIGQQIFRAAGTIRDAMPVVTKLQTITDVRDARQLQVTAGRVEFTDVQFEYQPARRVIRDLSLVVHAGEKVGPRQPAFAVL